MFPIHSVSGRVLGFGARILQSNAKAAKYLNSPENPIYHKSKVLYGLYQAKQEIVKKDEAYLVEGYTDVLSFHQNGVKNVVASSGTALTEGQIAMLKRYTSLSRAEQVTWCTTKTSKEAAGSGSTYGSIA